jgi:hypothetical protein
MTLDALAALSGLRDVQAACDAARTEIDALLWRRDIRSAAADVAADSRVRGARDSAAIDGADVAVADDSPMGRVLEAAERVTAAVPGQVEAFGRAPLQVLAHLHALTAVGMCEPDQLGRPRRDDSADDPLLLGNLPTAANVASRLSLLTDILTTPTTAPALVVAAIAHGELAVLRPFRWGSGLVARAVVRLVLAERGVDPSLFSIPEHGYLELGRSSYVSALRSYASGTSEGMSQFLVWHATALAAGARAVVVTSGSAPRSMRRRAYQVIPSATLASATPALAATAVRRA